MQHFRVNVKNGTYTIGRIQDSIHMLLKDIASNTYPILNDNNTGFILDFFEFENKAKKVLENTQTTEEYIIKSQLNNIKQEEIDLSKDFSNSKYYKNLNIVLIPYAYNYQVYKQDVKLAYTAWQIINTKEDNKNKETKLISKYILDFSNFVDDFDYYSDEKEKEKNKKKKFSTLWKDSKVRSDLNNRYLKNFPIDLLKHFKPTKITSNKIQTVDNIWIPSATELSHTSKLICSAEDMFGLLYKTYFHKKHKKFPKEYDQFMDEYDLYMENKKINPGLAFIKGLRCKSVFYSTNHPKEIQDQLNLRTHIRDTMGVFYDKNNHNYFIKYINKINTYWVRNSFSDLKTSKEVIIARSSGITESYIKIDNNFSGVVPVFKLKYN